MADSVAELLSTASTVAKEAGLLLAKHFTEARVVEYKGGIDLVTDADKLSEAHVLKSIRQRHPDHAILSEEAGAAVKGADGHRWIVDPLDGTTNYAHQVPHFCVSIAVEYQGKVMAGAIYDPIRNELFAAGRGLGATLNGTAIRPSKVTELVRALMCTGFPYNIHDHPEAPVGLLVRMLGKVQGMRRMGSAALDLAYVACGRLDGYFEFGLKPWDLAAGALIVEEAGGVMLGIDGQAWRTDYGDVLASAQGIAPALQKECRIFLDEVGYRAEDKRY